MKKATPHHQQLSLQLDAASNPSICSGTVVPKSVSLAKSDLTGVSTCGPSVVLDFQSVRSKRQASEEASLYRRILDSVRHIG